MTSHLKQCWLLEPYGLNHMVITSKVKTFKYTYIGILDYVCIAYAGVRLSNRRNVNYIYMACILFITVCYSEDAGPYGLVMLLTQGYHGDESWGQNP